jgi:hypothetical protein
MARQSALTRAAKPLRQIHAAAVAAEKHKDKPCNCQHCTFLKHEYS